MRVPVSWLRDYVPIEMPLDELATRLSVVDRRGGGIERRGVADAGGNLGLFRVGRVLEAEKHPNADRLQLDEGRRRGGRAARDRLRRVELRRAARRSAGRAAGRGAAERARARAAEGPRRGLRRDDPGGGRGRPRRRPRRDHGAAEAEPGTPLADVLPLVEHVLLVESTGNRPDLLSVYGLAREVAALYDCPLEPWPGLPRAGPERTGGDRDRRLRGLPAVHRAAASTDVAIGRSPQWLRARLVAAGMRPISNVVDVDELRRCSRSATRSTPSTSRRCAGADRRPAGRPGETLRTLDGVDRTLDPADLLIAEAERAIALAGIMGGEETEIGPGTTDVLLEAANFEPVGIFRTSERLRLRTRGRTGGRRASTRTSPAPPRTSARG
jgi:phenylalanyl-tRNA synthetase beta chain